MRRKRPLTLVVDDEPDIRELVALTLGRMDVHAETAANLEQARERLEKSRFDLCITDMRLPDGNGIDLVRLIQERHPQLPVAVITAHGNMESAISALKAGAFDFVSKPVDLQVLRRLVTTALRVSDKSTPRGDSRHELLGSAPAIEAIRRKIDKLARSQAPVYISGESGTGKELVARLVHARGPRAERPFVPVNCGAIPSELVESEFFGHKKGSFTGASADKTGLFQAADGGTLFLDEVAELPLHMQVKLLRAIQERAIRPIGATREIPIDVRILSATHKDLATLVTEGHFRQDLFYRINVIEIDVPPLRERAEDIPLLAEHLLNALAARNSDSRYRLSAEALDALRRYPFPGNVRELENILERATTLCDGESIETADLQLPESGSGAPHPNATSLEHQLDSVEKATIMRALEETRFNKTAAARRLGLSFGALRYRLRKLGID